MAAYEDILKKSPWLTNPNATTPPTTQAPASTYDPKTFDQSRLINKYWMAPTGVDYSKMAPANSRIVFQNGQYGYIPFSNQVGGRIHDVPAYYTENFVPFSKQPEKSPDFIRNPAQYQQQQVIDMYQKAMDDARSATESRYQEALKNLEGVGTQQMADLNQRYLGAGSAVNQSLVSSGLSGTTVLPTMQMGVERERTSAANRLAADLARERNAIIASRNDIPPDLAMLAQLMFQAGAGGY